MCSFPSAPASEKASVAYVSVAAWLMVKYCIFGWHRIKYDGISHWAGQQCVPPTPLPPGEHWPVVTWTEPEPVAPSDDQPLVTQSRKSQLSLGEARAVAGALHQDQDTCDIDVKRLMPV